MTNLDIARTRVATKRNFSKVSEDPAGATKAFQLRRDFIQNEDHLENIKTAQAKFTSIESGISQINSMALTVSGEHVITALNGTTSPEQRSAIAQALDQMRESMMLSLNAKDGDKYVFGGTNTKYPPFTLSENDELLYFYKEENGSPLYARVDDGVVHKDGAVYTDPATGNAVQLTADQLSALGNEKLYLDTGFGLQIDANEKTIPGTALNISYPAITLIGYGTEADGTPKNMISLLKELSTEIKKPEMDRALVEKLGAQFTKAKDRVLDHWTSVGTMSRFLETTEERLMDNRINLNTKIVDIENVNMEEAITEFEFAKYAYNAALKVGTSILQPSFIDFMK